MKGSDNSKVRMFKGHLNSTGHMVGKKYGCPEATQSEEGCEEPCYVLKIAKQWPSVKDKITDAYLELKECKTTEEYYAVIQPTVQKSYDQYLRRLKKKDIDPKELRRLKQRGHIFRHHWAGDVISIEHAKAIAQIAKDYPDTTFWIYTRTWWAVGAMRHIKNLAVYLSVDNVNESMMLKLRQEMPDVGLALLKEEGEDKTDKKLWRNEHKRTIVTCPATNGRLKSDGACVTCGACYNSTIDVVFLKH